MGKHSSPERKQPSGDTGKTLTSSVNSSNSIRRSRITETDVKKTEISKVDRAVNDDTRKPRVRDDLTARKPQTGSTYSDANNKFSDDTQRYVTSTTLITNKTAKIQDDQKRRPSGERGSPLRSSPERTATQDEYDDHYQETKTGSKYVTSSVAKVTHKGVEKTPDSVRRQIFADDDDHQQYDVSQKSSGYSRFTSSSSREVSKSQTSRLRESVTTQGQKTYSSSSRLPLEDKRGSPQIEFEDDDDENDGYQRSGYYVSSTVTERGSVRSSPDRTSSQYYEEDTITDDCGQRSDSKFTRSTERSTGSVNVTSIERTGSTTSSRSSTPNVTNRRRSSTPLDDKEDTSSPSTGFSRVARGGSVRALSQKFQQAAGKKFSVHIFSLP